MLEIRSGTETYVTRDYASSECGAKVIETNPNAKVRKCAVKGTTYQTYLLAFSYYL